MKTESSRFSVVRAYLEVLSFCVVIAGVPLFFLERASQTDDQRLARTLSLVDRFQQQDLSHARVNILAPWYKYRHDLHAIQKMGGMERGDYEALVLGIVDASQAGGARAGLIESINDLVEFFDSVSICMEQKLCDEAMSSGYFGQYARQFFCLYHPAIVRERSEMAMPSYGVRLERLVDKWGGCGEEAQVGSGGMRN